jgi:hypothetical protein
VKKSFDVSLLEFDNNVVIAVHLDELESINLYQNMNVEVAVGEPITFAGGATKQEVTVADSNALVKLVLWGENVGKLKCSYSKNFVVCEYGCSRFLGLDREGSEIVAIADIGSVKVERR